MKPVILTLRQIDLTDTRYDIFINKTNTSENPPVIDPLIVQQAGKLYRLIDGFDVISKDMDYRYEVPAYRIPLSETPLSILQILVKNRLRKRSLYPIEIARLFKLAMEDNISESGIAGKILPLLHLTRKPGIVQQYLNISTFRTDIADYLILRNAPLKTWLQIVKYPEDTRNFIGDLIQLQPTLSILEEMVSYLYEIHRRDNISVENLLSQLGWSGFFGKTKISSRERLQQLRRRVFEKRFPRLSEHKKQIDTMIDNLSLPGNARIDYDESFEQKALQLRWHLSSADDINNMERFATDKNIRSVRAILDKF